MTIALPDMENLVLDF